MKKLLVFIILICAILVPSRVVFSSGYDDFLCMKFFDEFRAIKYWARTSISVDDYDYGSGDSEYLGLKIKKAENSDIIKELNDHYLAEFSKYVKEKLPYHDTDAGVSERISKYVEKYKDNKSVDMGEKIMASEEARRRSLYGTNPGAMYCNIRISRRDFPILYEIESSIAANDNLRTHDDVREKSINYSSSEHIIAELKRAITDHMQKLGIKMNTIRNCRRK